MLSLKKVIRHTIAGKITSAFEIISNVKKILSTSTFNFNEQRTEESAPTIETTPAFSGLLNLKIGWNAETDAPVTVEFNRQTNNYLAVTGKSGSGKTQFVKDLLAQIRLQSEFKVNARFFRLRQR